MKRYQCGKCGGTKFILLRDTFTPVDFGREGAIKGCPHVGATSSSFQGMECADNSCRTRVRFSLAQEMCAEVI